jgi:hypothetical protein
MIITTYDKWVLVIQHMIYGSSCTCTNSGHMGIKTLPYGPYFTFMLSDHGSNSFIGDQRNHI